MKLVTWFLAGSLVVGTMACDNKGEAPAGNVQVSGEALAKTEAVPAPAPSAAPSAPGTPAATSANAEAAAPAGTTTVASVDDKHEGCGHAIAGEPIPTDCPFGDERHAAADKLAAGEGGCHAMAEGEPAKPTADGATQHFGSAFTLADSKPLASVVTGEAPAEDTLIRVAGTVEKVCQKKGCWMVVKDGDVEARVTMKDYAFFMPFDAAGKKVVIEGTLKIKTFTEAQAKHLAEDGNEDPAKVQGEKKEYVLTASGVQLGG